MCTKLETVHLLSTTWESFYVFGTRLVKIGFNLLFFLSFVKKKKNLLGFNLFFYLKIHISLKKKILI